MYTQVSTEIYETWRAAPARGYPTPTVCVGTGTDDTCGTEGRTSADSGQRHGRGCASADSGQRHDRGPTSADSGQRHGRGRMFAFVELVSLGETVSSRMPGPDSPIDPFREVTYFHLAKCYYPLLSAMDTGTPVCHKGPTQTRRSHTTPSRRAQTPNRLKTQSPTP